MATDRFNLFVPLTLKFEGGSKVVNNPSDPGGPTQYGIASKYHPSLRDAIVQGKLTKKQALEIYYDEYYRVIPGIEAIDIRLAFVLFDSRVHGMFPGYVIDLQEDLKFDGFDIQVDGDYGPRTAAAAAALTRDQVTDILKRMYVRSAQHAARSAQRVIDSNRAAGRPFIDYTHGFLNRSIARLTSAMKFSV